MFNDLPEALAALEVPRAPLSNSRLAAKIRAKGFGAASDEQRLCTRQAYARAFASLGLSEAQYQAMGALSFAELAGCFFAVATAKELTEDQALAILVHQPPSGGQVPDRASPEQAVDTVASSQSSVSATPEVARPVVRHPTPQREVPPRDQSPQDPAVPNVGSGRVELSAVAAQDEIALLKAELAALKATRKDSEVPADPVARLAEVLAASLKGPQRVAQDPLPQSTFSLQSTCGWDDYLSSDDALVSLKSMLKTEYAVAQSTWRAAKLPGVASGVVAVRSLDKPEPASVCTLPLTRIMRTLCSKMVETRTLPAPSRATPRGVKKNAAVGVSLSIELPPLTPIGPLPATVVTPLWLPSRHTLRTRPAACSATMIG